MVYTAQFWKLKNNFINECVVYFWNKLATDIKLVQSINSFRCMMDEYKLNYSYANVVDTWNFFELSYEVLDYIEGNNYVENKKFIMSI